MKSAGRPILRYVAAALLIAASAVFAFGQAGARTGVRSVTIESEPGAKVWIDGVLYGSTSSEGVLEIRTVRAGRRAVRVRADGFREVQKTLLPAQSGKVSVPLERTTDEAELAFQDAERLASVDRDRAAVAYLRAIKLKPGFLDAHVGLARVYLDAGDFEKADKAIAAARRIKTGNAEISAIEGRLLKSVDDEAKAVAAFKRAIREGGGFQPEAYAGLGLLYKEKAENFGAEGDFAKEKSNYAAAAKYLSTAIDQLSGAPDAVVLYQFLGLVYEQQKDYSRAIAVYRQFLKFFPGHPESQAFESFIVQLKKQAAESN